MWANSDMGTISDVIKAVALLGCLLLGGCMEATEFDEKLVSTHSASEIEIMGARGPQSQKQSKVVLNRLAAQAPDAGALERHLAGEQAVAESPLYAGNTVRILRDGEQTFPAMFAAIHGARRYLYLEYYIFEDVSCYGEQLSEVLIAKAREGVQIQLMFVGIGSLTTFAVFFVFLLSVG